MIIFVLICLIYVIINALFNANLIKWQQLSVDIQRIICDVGFAPKATLKDKIEYSKKWHRYQSLQITIVGILIIYLFSCFNIQSSWTTLFHGFLLAGIFHSFRFLFFDPILNLAMEWNLFYTGSTSDFDIILKDLNFPLKIVVLIITAGSVWYLATIYGWI